MALVLLIVIIVIVVVAIGVVLLASRNRAGTPEGSTAEPLESKAAVRGLTAALVLVCAFGLVVPALVLVANAEHKASVGVGGVHLDANQQKGRELFSHSCNLCHTLAGANAVGRTGPNLDVLVPTVASTVPNEKLRYIARKAFVLSAILEGRALGRGQMPKLLFQGKEAEDVAGFVAAIAGH
jgi:mono/diheme cytochrome c family protein